MQNDNTLNQQINSLKGLDAFSEYQTDEKLDPTLRNWKIEPATQAQVRYVFVLTKMMGLSGDEANAEYDFHHLTKGEMDILLKRLEEENGIEPEKRRSDNLRDIPKTPKSEPKHRNGFYKENGKNTIDGKQATCGSCVHCMPGEDGTYKCSRKTWVSISQGTPAGLLYCFEWIGGEANGV